MFVRYYLELPVAFDETEAALLRSPERWLPGIATDAEGHAASLLGEVGIPSERRAMSKRVRFELGRPLRIAAKTILPITWEATGPRGLFPAFEGDLEVAALGATRTQLSISVRYRPPLGVVGRAVDRALLHRLAEAIVKDFADRVGSALRDLVAPEVGGPPAPVRR